MSRGSRYKEISQSSHSISVTVFGSRPCEAACSEFMCAACVVLSCVYLLHFLKKMFDSDRAIWQSSQSIFIRLSSKQMSGKDGRMSNKKHWWNVSSTKLQAFVWPFVRGKGQMYVGRWRVCVGLSSYHNWWFNITWMFLLLLKLDSNCLRGHDFQRNYVENGIYLCYYLKIPN